MDIKIRITVVVVLGSTVTVLVAVLCILWAVPDLPETSLTVKLCLPLTTDVPADLQCGDMVDIMHNYVQQTIETTYEDLQKQEEKKNKEIEDNKRPIGLRYFMQNHYWEMKPAARFTGIIQSELKHSHDGLVPIREWRHGRQLTDNGGFRRYGMKYVNGRIVVPVGGIYLIYSFVDMYEPCIEGTGIPNILYRNQSIKHSIFKFNILDKYETELISGVQPHLKSANLYFNIYSSFISAVVSLSAGDELVVKVSNITYLKYPDVNYFGVNLI